MSCKLIYRYRGARPGLGTAVWYGDSAVGGVTTTTQGTGPTESQGPTTTTTPLPTTTTPPVS